METDMPQKYDLYNDKTYDALSKRTNSSMHYAQLVLAPALSYMHDAIAFSEVTLDWCQDEKDPPTVEELSERVFAAHNTFKDVFSLLNNRYTMLQLRASMESDATSHGGAEALRAKLAFIEEKVYAGSDGLVSDSVLTKWLKEFDTTKAKAVMNTHAKASAKVSTFRDRQGGKGKGAAGGGAGKGEGGRGSGKGGKGAEQKGGMARSWREFRGHAVDQQRGKDALGRQGAFAFRSRSVFGRRHPSAAGVDGRRDRAVSQDGRMGTSEEETTCIPSVPGAEAGDKQVASSDGLPLVELALRQVPLQDGDAQEAATARQAERLVLQLRPLGRIPHCGDRPRLPGVHAVRRAGGIIPLRRPSLRLERLVTNIRQGHEGARGVPAFSEIRGGSAGSAEAAKRKQGATTLGSSQTSWRGGREEHQQGARVLPYMDDFLLLLSSRIEALRARELTSRVLVRLGLSRNEKKRQWEPTQLVEHLGLEVDLKAGQFRVTPARLQKIHLQSKALLSEASRQRRWLPARKLAAFTGLCQSVYLAVPPARLYLRELHFVLSTRRGWGAKVKLTRQAWSDIEWWLRLPAQSRWNGRKIWRSPTRAKVHTDASLFAWGGVLNLKHAARGFWSDELRHLHITHLELEAVYKTVLSFLRELTGKVVRLYCVNQAVVAMLSHFTSRNPELMRRMRRVWILLDLNDIELQARYIRSEANEWADRLSRDRDLDDWRLNRKWFQWAEREWHQHTVDRFASELSAQLPRYYAQWHGPGCEGVDSLAFSWLGEVNWVNPPWSLLDEVAHKLREEKRAATVVAPYWPGQMWFQQLEAMAEEVVILTVIQHRDA
ncbi:hypothetical protein CYMTET_56327 [Cymbomonas tetramitiformis]|uniref:Uncharacterized protein n=1 Tax=Cymbomonas tetramitiformis TaxID=36881 RepID=A0AAE0BCD6_9CHLO|nr:hypothetical protein CYMTET_56327 [Cymbomonas tetramitiformis]